MRQRTVKGKCRIFPYSFGFSRALFHKRHFRMCKFSSIFCDEDTAGSYWVDHTAPVCVSIQVFLSPFGCAKVCLQGTKQSSTFIAVLQFRLCAPQSQTKGG